ncbi:hypothetical protein ABPG77_000165 [Micractinium sp. CCAP 211/92]
MSPPLSVEALTAAAASVPLSASRSGATAQMFTTGASLSLKAPASRLGMNTGTSSRNGMTPSTVNVPEQHEPAGLMHLAALPCFPAPPPPLLSARQQSVPPASCLSLPSCLFCGCQRASPVDSGSRVKLCKQCKEA